MYCKDLFGKNIFTKQTSGRFFEKKPFQDGPLTGLFGEKKSFQNRSPKDLIEKNLYKTDLSKIFSKDF